MKEQVTADLVWRFAKEVSEAESRGESLRYSRDELSELVEILQCAGGVPEALHEEEAPGKKERVASRLRRILDEAEEQRAAVVPAPAAPHRPVFAPWMVWAQRFAAGAAVILAVALLSVDTWHRPPQRVEVQRVRVPVEASELQIDAIDEPTAHRFIPRLVNNTLAQREERNLLWHMLVCRGCYDEYVELRASSRHAGNARPEVIRASWGR
jgi:hypothetical protein